MVKLWGYDVKSCWSVFKTMLSIDFEQARETFVAKMIDRLVWVGSWAMVSAYLLPTFGVSADFGKFMLVGLVVSVGIMDAYSAIALIISDLEGDRVLTYFLTLPIPSALVFIRILIYYGLYYSVLGLALFPLCNLFLPQPIAYSSIDIPKSLLMLLLSNFFHAAMTLWAATFVRDMRMLGHVWSRVIHPFWLMGGFQFTWAALHKKSVLLSYIALCNPLLHAFEGMRSAVLGSKGYLPYWLSAFVLFVSIIFMTSHAIVRFKKRLDLV